MDARALVLVAALLQATALGAPGCKAAPAPLPDYEVSLVGGDQTSHGAPAQLRSDTLRVRSDTRVQIAARPASAPTGDVATRAFLLEGGTPRLWDAPVETSPEGVLRIAGEAGALFPSKSGDWDIVLAIGRPGALPTTGNLLPMLDQHVPTLKIVRCHVVVSGGG